MEGDDDGTGEVVGVGDVVGDGGLAVEVVWIKLYIRN